MKKYKAWIIVIGILVLVILGVGGYCYSYMYRVSHPTIYLHVGAGGVGKKGNFKLETPYISYAASDEIGLAPEVELQITDVWMQHEFTCMDLREHYKNCDVKLDITVKNHQTIMTYHGTATTLAGKKKTYYDETVFDFVMDMEYTKTKST